MFVFKVLLGKQVEFGLEFKPFLSQLASTIFIYLAPSSGNRTAREGCWPPVVFKQPCPVPKERSVKQLWLSLFQQREAREGFHPKGEKPT
jgi:hypothetical protein